NNDLYTSLSPELQAIVDEAGLEACRYQREINRADDEKMLAKWEEKGVKVHRMTEAEAEAFKALSAPVYDEFRDELTPELVDAFTK
ncbi:MAG: transporter, partial [Oscillospiraceae bacterium]|nr:transporter [Oscillospiraceae bacterium]